MPEETIEEILFEMRMNHDHIKSAKDAGLGYFADRIEEALKRLLRRNEMLKIRLKCIEEEYLKTKRENNRLRAALKQVLDYDIDTHPCDGYCVMLNAVREAQRIAKEGEAK